MLRDWAVDCSSRAEPNKVVYNDRWIGLGIELLLFCSLLPIQLNSLGSMVGLVLSMSRFVIYRGLGYSFQYHRLSKRMPLNARSSSSLAVFGVAALLWPVCCLSSC